MNNSPYKPHGYLQASPRHVETSTAYAVVDNLQPISNNKSMRGGLEQQTSLAPDWVQ